MDKKHLIKIVGYLLEDTIIDYDNTTIQLVGSDLEYDIEFIHDEFFSMLWDMLKNNYGLNGDEIVYVFGNYLYQINKKIKLSGSINESVENKEKYLDKIVQYILDDTELDYEQKLVTYPFIPNTPSQWGLSVPLHYVQYESPFFKEYSKYCKDIYGLSYEESVYVWDRYVNISGLY